MILLIIGLLLLSGCKPLGYDEKLEPGVVTAENIEQMEYLEQKRGYHCEEKPYGFSHGFYFECKKY